MTKKKVKVFLQLKKAKLRRAGGKMAKELHGFEIYLNEIDLKIKMT